MTVLFVVLPLALLIAAAALWGFGWAVKRGQFDDLETPGRRMLLDDDPVADASEPAEEESPRS